MSVPGSVRLLFSALPVMAALLDSSGWAKKTVKAVSPEVIEAIAEDRGTRSNASGRRSP